MLVVWAWHKRQQLLVRLFAVKSFHITARIVRKHYNRNGTRLGESKLTTRCLANNTSCSTLRILWDALSHLNWQDSRTKSYAFVKSNKQGNSVIRASVPVCLPLEVKIGKGFLLDWVMLWSGAYECHNWLSFVFTRWRKRRGYCNFQEWIFSKLNQRSFAFRLDKKKQRRS